MRTAVLEPNRFLGKSWQQGSRRWVEHQDQGSAYRCSGSGGNSFRQKKGSNAGCTRPFIKAHRSFPKPSTIKTAPIPKVPVVGPPANEWLLRSKVGLLLCAAGPDLARSLCGAFLLSELPHHRACISISKPHLPSTHPPL